MKTLARMGVSGLLLASLLATAPAAMAKDGDKIKTGSCTAGGDWKLKVGPEDGGKLEVEFEVEHVQPGSTWNVKLLDNGTAFFQGTRTANQFGRFEVNRLTDNKAGDDQITGRARNPNSGQVCKGTLTF